ncbi:MAG TPA: CHAT domain-containing protein [Bryobacteraceae bacterium]|nr:CHAT domain-containing protein [Bryobacteraceae bacterium]
MPYKGLAIAVVLCVSPIRVAAQQPDEAGIHLLAQKLRSAYGAKDLDAILSLWSDSSPQRAAARDATQKLLSAGSGVEIRESTVRAPEFDGDHARLRIEREITALAPVTKTPGNGKKSLVLECVREQGEWKIWKETPATEDLAGRLAKTTTDKDQADLLADNEDLIGSELALALIDRGRDARNHGDLKQALRIQALASSIAERAGAQQARALALNNTGLIYYDQGDFAEALNWYQRSLALSESLHDDAGTARSLNNIGAVLMDCGDLSGAWDNFQKSLALGEKTHNARLISNATGNTAIVYGRRGDYLQALALFKKTYDRDEPSGDRRAISIDLIDLGNLFLWQGNYAQSEDYFQRALATAESGGLKPLMGYALEDLGRVAEFRGDLQGAVAKYERSLAICNEVGDKVCASNALSFIGSISSQLGDQAKALDYFRKSLEIHQVNSGGQEQAFTLAKMAEAYNRKGDFQEAAHMAAEALSLSETAGLREAMWRAHLEAGKAYQGLREIARAEKEFAQSIATIEEMRLNVAGAESEQENFFEDKLEPYHRMLGVFVAAKRDREAFQFAERAKARVLVDVLKNGRTQLAGLMTAEERDRDRDLRINLASLNAQLMRAHQAPAPDTALVLRLSAELDQARLAYSGYETALYAQHPQWKLQSGAMEPVTLEQALQLTPGADTAFLEFVVTDDTLYSFVSAGGGVRVFTAPVSRKKLADQVERFRRQIAERNLGFRASAAALYGLLLAPPTRELQNKHHLIIIPDGVLWELPFQALINPAGQYVLDTSSVSYAPSLTALKAMIEVKRGRKQAPAGVQLLAMGNPAWGGQMEQRVKSMYRDQELGSIPLAETEVRRLATIYGEKESHIYIGTEARESRFKAEAGEAHVLHLATHGILNNASPMYSYLLLAGEGDGSPDDGLLEAQELLHMQLRAELVVLSACETARGRVGAGEGVIGLSWALFVAGVPATVLSQWKVDSESTSRLMVAFHQNRKNGMNDAEALRRAALLIRKEPAYQHPFYWTPFILIGANN